MAKKGKLLEQLVGKIQEVIKDNNGTSIETGVKLNDTLGILREFDVLVRTSNQGLAVNIAFECKDYSTSQNKPKVDVKVVDALIGKCKDCPEINNKIIVSTTGFTSSAIKKAAANGITLLAIEDITPESILAPSNVKLMKNRSKLGVSWLYLYGDNQWFQSDQSVECWDSNTDTEINILDCIKQQMNWSDLHQEQTKAYIKNGQKRTDMLIAFEISNMYIKDINNHKYPLHRILIPFGVDFETYEGQIEQVQHLTQGSFDVDTTTFGFGLDGIKIKSIATQDKQKCYFQINDTLKTPKFIGKLWKQGWEIKKLGEVATYINGYAFKPEHWAECGVPIIRIQNLNNQDAVYNYCNMDIPKKFVVEYGDILISWSASLGVYEWNGERSYLNQHIFKVVFDKCNINKYFFKYAVSSKINEMLKNAHGATMKHIIKRDFDNTEIIYPSIAEQERIVGELDCLSGIIAAKRAQLRELDTLAQSIFYTMFGDPITNDKGWQTKKLPELCSVISTGITYKPENVSDDGIIVLRSGNIQNSQFVLDDIVRINMSLKESQYVQQNDILMCSRNGSARLVGKVALVPNLTERMSWGAFMTIIRSEFYHFLFQYFQLPAFRQQLIKTKTSTVNQITIGMLKDISIPVPPINLQNEFAEKIENIERQKELITKSIKETEDLFNSRMSYYFN